MDERSGKSLASSVEEAVSTYLATMDDQEITELYELVLREVEVPLMRSVLRHTHNNQSKCASILGLNRATLRKKLAKYGLL